MSAAPSVDPARSLRGPVLALAGIAAASALAGGGFLLANLHGSAGAPLTLLASTPFETFLVPGLLLAGVVGGALLGCFVLVARRSAYATDAVLFAGGTLTLWIACEAVILAQYSWLQLVYGGVGLLLLGGAGFLALRSGVPRHRWIVLVTLGEALGFLAPSIAGIVAVRAELSPVARAVVVVLAGGVEGLACGAAQAWAFPLPIRRGRFAALTALGAALVWALAMSIVLAGHRGLAASWIVALVVVSTPIALGAMGVAQWIELRHHARRAHRWIGWTALAWLLALPASFTPMPLVDEHTPVFVHGVLWSSAGIAMAYVMALVTWQGARRATPIA